MYALQKEIMLETEYCRRAGKEWTDVAAETFESWEGDMHGIELLCHVASLFVFQL